MTMYFAMEELPVFIPLIIVGIIIFIALVVFLAAKSMQNSSTGDNKTSSTGFFKGLLDEINTEFGQKQSESQPVEYNQKSEQKAVKNKPKSIASQAKPVQTAPPTQTTRIAPSMDAENPQEENSLLDEMLEDENIMTKLVLGEMILTPRARKRNIRRLF